MDNVRDVLAFSTLSDEWCNSQLSADFCSSSWPESWEFKKSLLGLELPFENLIKFIRKKENKFWDSIILSDVIRLQCITNIVLESCIQNEGSQLTGIYCGSAYIRICSLEGASARNMFHTLLFGKIMELLKVFDDPESLHGINDMYNSLTLLLKSDLSLPDHSYWTLLKSLLASINNNCSRKNVKKHIFQEIFSSIIPKIRLFKFFIKEVTPYLLSGSCYIADKGTQLIIDIFSRHENSDNVTNHYINLIQHICTHISDRTELRKQTEVYILRFLFVLTKENLIHVLEWVLNEYVLSCKVVHRIFATELFFQLLFNEKITKDERISRTLLEAIVKNLHDKAPTVRAKSLMILSDIVKHFHDSKALILNDLFIPNNKENILMVIEMLSLDEKSSVRKSVCHLLTMMLLYIRIRGSWLTTLYHLCLDTAVSVRKQALCSVSLLLENHWENPTIQRLWLETILPAVNDNENSVKDYGISQLTSMINNLDNEDAWVLLKLIANPKSTDLQVFFDFGMQSMITNGYKMSNSCKAIVADKLLNHDYKSTALLMMTKLTNQFDNILFSKYVDILETSLLTKCDDSYQVLMMVLNCFKEKKISHSEYCILYTVLKDQLQQYDHPFAVIKELSTTLARLAFKHDKEQFFADCHHVINSILSILQLVCLKEITEDVQYTSKKLNCYLFTMGEIIQFINHSINMDIVIALKELIINNEDSSFSTSVRAQAIITLGKICLVHENVAKDSVTLLSRVLESDGSFMIRNNILVVLSDMIIRYPTLVQEYLYCVTDCLHDSSLVVKRQAIILLTKLLQEDYLKWRSGIVMKFISNLVDDNLEIRKLCELCLTNVLLVRHPKTYFDYFIEVLFFANGLFSLITSSEPNLKQFALPGSENDQKRKTIYSKMLQNLTDQQKLEVTARVCKEILTMFINESTDTIEENMKPLLKDALWILCCPSLKLSSLKPKTNNDFDDDDSNINVLNAQTKVVSNIVKRNFVENCAPIIIALRQKLCQLKSPMQLELTMFMVSFIKDYKDEIEMMLGADSQLISEIQYDMQEIDNEIEINLERFNMNKTINKILLTPGFLKNLKTPQSNRSLNISLANGPESLFRSPFFAVPSPRSVARPAMAKCTMSNLSVSPNYVSMGIHLRKNLLSQMNTVSNLVKPSVRQSSVNDQKNVYHDILNSPKTIRKQVIKIGNSPISNKTSESIVITSSELSTDNQAPLQESIQITNTVPEKDNLEVISNKMGILKQELLSPKLPANKPNKGPKTLYNPDTAINLSIASNKSTDKSLKWTTPSARLLLKQTDTGVVKIQKTNKSKRALLLTTKDEKPIGSNYTNETDNIPIECDDIANLDNAKNQEEGKPLLLGELIRNKLKQQRLRKAERTQDALINNQETTTSSKFLNSSKGKIKLTKIHPSELSHSRKTDKSNPKSKIQNEKMGSVKTANDITLKKRQEGIAKFDESENLSQNKVVPQTKKSPHSKQIQPYNENTGSKIKVVTQKEVDIKQICATSVRDDNLHSLCKTDSCKEPILKLNPSAQQKSKCIDSTPIAQYTKLLPIDHDSTNKNIKEKESQNNEKLKPNSIKEIDTFGPPKSKPVNFTEILKKGLQKRYKSIKEKAIAIDANKVGRLETLTESVKQKTAVTVISSEAESMIPKVAESKKPILPEEESLQNEITNKKKENTPPNPEKAKQSRLKKHNVERLLKQFQPNSAQTRGDVIEKPKDILLTNQVLRKRKVGSEYLVFNESDMKPPAKRRSLDDVIKMVDVTFDKQNLVSSTPAPPVTRNQTRLIKFDNNNPKIITSTPMVPPKRKTRNSRGLVTSTPFVGKAPVIQELDCDMSPIKNKDEI